MGVLSEANCDKQQLLSSVLSGMWYKQQLTSVAKNFASASVLPEANCTSRVGDVLQDARDWCAFEFADQMEQGIAPGLTSSFIEPLASTEEVKDSLQMRYSEDCAQCVLQTTDGTPLLLAVSNSTEQRVDIYLTEPGEPPAAIGPAFLLRSLSSKQDEWVLESKVCECCQGLGRRSCGTRELLHISHYDEIIGEGKARCMDIELPAAGDVWCSACCSQQQAPAVTLSSRRPRWLPNHRALTMNFYGRCKMASTRNFMLEYDTSSEQTEQDMRMLFGKIGDNLYALDYKRPFGMVQAFAVALTSTNWR